MGDLPGFPDLPHALAAACFANLSPQSLAIASCVNRQWRGLAGERPWANFYAELWDPDSGGPGSSDADWQRRCGARQAASRCWLGRPATDTLVGHSAAVKACCMLPHLGLLFTAGVDRCVRAWDLQSGTQLGASRRHAGTVRCLAADADLLASGSSDHSVRLWRTGSSSAALPFDLPGDREVLAGHAGPVSCLQLAPDVLIR